MASGGKISVLFVDDELQNLESFKATFRRDFQVYTCISVPDALELLKNQEVQIVLSDQRMPGMTGVEFFEIIQKEYPELIRILITGYADINIVVDAVNKGKIYKYLQKPWDNDTLKAIIMEAYEVYDKNMTEKRDLEELKIMNEQLEFIARQNLIS